MKIVTWGIGGIAGLAAAGAVLAATPASAHGAPFTVTAGSAPAGTSVPVTLTTSGSAPRFTWKDTTTNALVSCSSVTLKGTVTTGAGTGLIGSIDAARAAFVNCTGPAGWKFAITGVGTWTLRVTDSTSGASAITIGNVRAHLEALAGPACRWDFAAPTGSFTSSSTATAAPGTLATRYTNSSTSLALPATDPGSLGLWNVRGGTGGTNTYCVSPSIWKQGDRMSWSTTWTLAADASANNPVAVT